MIDLHTVALISHSIIMFFIKHKLHVVQVHCVTDT